MKNRSVMNVGLAVVSACALTLLGSTNASASSIACATFGPLPAATFGGSGIPNTSVCQSTFVVGTDTITIGIEAHERFSNAVVTNDGAGTYFAGAGANFGDPTFATTPSLFLGATWNHAIYVSIAGGGQLANYAISFLYEVDPAAAPGAFGSINISGAGGSSFQASENLNFAFFCSGAPGVTPPGSGCPFNPLVPGVYNASIEVRSVAGALLGTVADQVNVAANVPEPASLVLLGSGMLGLMARRRVKRAKAA